MKAIEKDPEKRFQDVNEIQESINQFERQPEKTQTMVVNPLQPKRSKKPFAFVAIVVVLAAVLLVVSVFRESLLSRLQTFADFVGAAKYHELLLRETRSHSTPLEPWELTMLPKNALDLGLIDAGHSSLAPATEKAA